MKNITIILSLIMFISLASAYYPGDTITIENNFGAENLVYTIIENSTPVNPIVSVNSTNISVFLPFDISPGSFTLVFIEEQTKEVVKEVYIGGGSSCRKCKETKKEPEKNGTTIIWDVVAEDPDEPINITDDQPEEEKNIFDKKIYGLFIMIFVVLCGVIFWLCVLLKKNKKLKNIKKKR